jgi:hypothetical protein
VVVPEDAVLEELLLEDALVSDALLEELLLVAEELLEEPLLGPAESLELPPQADRIAHRSAGADQRIISCFSIVSGPMFAWWCL